jgi:hypothetical protein
LANENCQRDLLSVGVGQLGYQLHPADSVARVILVLGRLGLDFHGYHCEGRPF